MQHVLLNLRRFWPFLVHVILLSCKVMYSESVATLAFCNETDHLALLAFKDKITQDPLRVMSSWNNSFHFCDWIGVTCSPSNGRVTILNLEAQSLVGSISPSIGNLTFLTGINLQNNSFHGEIPQEVGRLLRLQRLNLSFNSFTGKIPTNLTHCLDVRILDVSFNQLIGSIPHQLSSLSKLVILGFRHNNLTGTIPAWIGNFTHLIRISLSHNGLQGNIPNELGKLSHLSFFTIYGNNLSGTIPPSLYNLSSIYYFSVTQNQLHGHLPPDIGLTLPNLQVFAGGVNSFTGPIPTSLSNASGLEILDFAENGLTGPMPVSFGNLHDLTRLNFDDNRLGNGEVGDLDFLAFLANCTELEVLGVAYNRLGGELPSSVANLSTHLRIFTMGGNLIHGSIPIGIENFINLTLLGMEVNFFTGRIPEAIGKLQNLQRWDLNVNGFSGLIPSSLGNLSRLTTLYMDDNSFEGSIPPSLGNCQNLLLLNLSYNKLNNSIPKEVIGLSSLSISLAMAHNSLTGSLPLEVGNLKSLEELDVSQNKLTGEIPTTIGDCLSMERLHMEGNYFQGTIPKSLSMLRSLRDLDLSRNNLSGQIPEYLGKLSLISLNLSFNDLEGNISSEGIFANASAVSILGNNKLCGGVSKLHLPACSRQTLHTKKTHITPRTIIIVVAAFLFIVLVLLATFCWMRNSRKRTSTTSREDCKSGASYRELFRSTNGFSVDNLIGAGSFGSVYKGIHYHSESIVAVKVLNLQQHGASKSFIAEFEALKNVRHRNLVKVKNVCSSVDFQGNDFKALVFDFMSNGNLDQWLHPRADEQHKFMSLKLTQRLNIAIDVASALVYLHHHCQTPIIHCDLKPSNILLDEDMTAHVSDFGLARFLFEASNSSSKTQTISVGLKGSIGYIPPEYGMGGHLSILGDVYSYGILLLEMFTGKRPTDDMFHDGQSIHDFVTMALPEQVMEVVDPQLFSEEDKGQEEEADEIAKIKNENHQNNFRSRVQECLVSLIRIGLACSKTSPRDRIMMTIVVNELHAIRKSFVGIRFQNR